MKEVFLSANLKKYQFYQKKVQFFDYIIFLQDICIENERIKVIKKWLKPQLVRDI